MRIKIFYFLVLLINSFPISNLLKILRPLLRKYLNKRSAYSFHNIHQLSENIPLGLHVLATPELHKSNDWYGNATLLKKFLGIDENYQLKTVIEHGVHFGDFIWEQDKDSDLPVIITMSKKRALFLKKQTNKETFSIGPYIHYAKPYLNEFQQKRENKRLGQNLLVFPTHSTAVLSVSYNIKQFIKEIKKIGKNFDSVRICLYWKDIQIGLSKLYQSAGFVCVTAGHIFDPSFTSRLKSIISLSEYTMTNAIGTYTGYCIYMNKPHYLYQQDLKQTGSFGSSFKANTISKINKDLKVIEDALSTYTSYISKHQYSVANDYWGFDQVKTPHQLGKIFQLGEKLCNGN